MSPTEEKAAAEALAKLGDSGVDISTFEQILEMDDEEDEREFSKSLVFGFFEQVETTFSELDTALEEKDLAKLSSLGHFLKGSSATLGLQKVQDSCEKIQRYGKNEKLDGSPLDDDKTCLDLITDVLKVLKEDYDEVETALKKFYD